MKPCRNIPRGRELNMSKTVNASLRNQELEAWTQGMEQRASTHSMRHIAGFTQRMRQITMADPDKKITQGGTGL